MQKDHPSPSALREALATSWGHQVVQRVAEEGSATGTAGWEAAVATEMGMEGVAPHTHTSRIGSGPPTDNACGTCRSGKGSPAR